MLDGRDLAGRALDQRDHVFAGEPTDLDAKVLGLRVQLRPVGEASARRVEEPKQAARRTVVDFSPQTRRPSRRPSFAGPAHSHNRMTLAIYTAPQKACKTPPQPRLKRSFLKPAVDTPQNESTDSSVEALYFSAICRTFRSGGTRIRTGDTMIFSHVQEPLGMRKTRVGMRISVRRVPVGTT
jgi:hypothetical protein